MFLFESVTLMSFSVLHNDVTYNFVDLDPVLHIAEVIYDENGLPLSK